MKSVFSFLLLSLVSSSYSQVLEPGVYKANSKGQKLTLRIFEGNKYEMAVFQGRFSAENDTITFLNSDTNSSAFQVKVNKEAPFSSSLKVKFKTQILLYAGSNIYIGTQKEENAVIEYKPLLDFVNKRAFGYAGRQKDIRFDVDKGKYLYFVELNNNSSATVSKFEINPNDNEIEVDYDGASLLNIELKGVINPETKKLSIMEGNTRRDILEFEKENGNADILDGVQPIAVSSEKDWKKSHGFLDENEFDGSYLEKRAKSKYTFKHTVLKSYSEALKSIEKSPEKFLVVTLDSRKEAVKEFDAFLKSNGEAVSRTMYKGYDSKKDRFNFYLATEKDKAVISNFKIKDKTALVFLNSSGEVLYHTEGTLDGNSDLFNLYYSVYDELKKANEQFKLDKLFANKKATLADFKKSLFDVSNTKGSFNYDSEIVEEFEPAADSVAMPYDGDFRVENPENLYSVKTPKEAVAAKWNAIIDFYAKNNTYDEDFIEMSKEELNNTGFTQKLYGAENLFVESDFKVLDYLFKNYDEILKREAKPKNPPSIAEYYDGADDEMMYRTASAISASLAPFFNKMTAESAHLHRANQIKLIEYYKKYLQFSGFRIPDMFNYLQRIKEINRNDNSAYFKEYDEYYNAFAAKNSSMIETLDEMFAAQKNNYMNWIDFKHDFSRLANNVAWVVVESRNSDPAMIQKAIKWSETSLKITPNEFHYLDTLAQLYYINNEKQKAIATEQQAIDALNANDKERKQSYTEVLESMKNGTY